MAKKSSALIGLAALGAIGWFTKDMWLPKFSSASKPSVTTKLSAEEMIDKIERINEGMKLLKPGSPDFVTLKTGKADLAKQLLKLGYVLNTKTGDYEKKDIRLTN